MVWPGFSDLSKNIRFLCISCIGCAKTVLFFVFFATFFSVTNSLAFFVFPVLAVHKPYYFLYFPQLFFCHKFLGFLCISCKGCPQTILFLVRNRWSRYLPGSFRMSEQLDCSFYFMSCLCRYMVGLHTFASFVLHRSACGSRPLVQTFLQTFP